MLPIVSIVGKSGTGKTELIESLIAEFKKRGYKIATIKHSQGGIEIDRPGKDSWRFAQAGSETVVFSSPDKLAFIRTVDHDTDIEEIMHVIGNNFDLVLVEGFKKGKAAKIEVHRKELGDGLLCPDNELLAVVTNETLDIDIPQLSFSDTEGIANFIEKNFISQVRHDI